MQPIHFKQFILDKTSPLTLILGPCVIEGEDLAMQAAEVLTNLSRKYGFQLIYKSSYDKANRSSIHSYRGIGIDEGLRILEKIQREFNVPITTDVHSPEEAKAAGEICDVLQVPAFLCRQTDLIIACGNTGKIVNVKKGQFLAPWDMKNVVVKLEECGNTQMILTERGFTFGYNNLSTDMRSFPIMKEWGYPVCFDATHAVQLPGGEQTSSGGDRKFILPLAKAALAAGADLLFMEAHSNPSEAKSDAKTQLSFKELEEALPRLIRLFETLREIAK